MGLKSCVGEAAQSRGHANERSDTGVDERQGRIGVGEDRLDRIIKLFD